MNNYSLSAVALVLACLPLSAQSLSNGNGDLRVMTYNANEGADFLQIQQASDPFSFLVAVGQTITQVRATDPPARMKALRSRSSLRRLPWSVSKNSISGT